MFTLRQRQLLWLIFSPNILKKAIDTNCEAFEFASNHKQIATLLEKARQNKQLNSLRETIRLGILFENLCYFYLEQIKDKTNSQCYKNINPRLQINSEGKFSKTLGEFDFLFQEQASNKSCHLETAVKFYLADVINPEEIGKLSSWIGPNRNDRLDIKINKLFNHQLQLSDLESSAKTLQQLSYRNPIKKQFLLKGVLFLPYRKAFNRPENYQQHFSKLLNTAHETGFWINIGQTQELLSDLDYAKILTRQQWLGYDEIYDSYFFDQLSDNTKDHEIITETLQSSELSADKLRNYTQLKTIESQRWFLTFLVEKLTREKKPFQISGLKKMGDQYQINRYFIVSDDWSAITEPS